MDGDYSLKTSQFHLNPISLKQTLDMLIAALLILAIVFPQIVRTDLKELMEMDLDGAPYAYTPFCDDRTEMDGFRYSHVSKQTH